MRQIFRIIEGIIRYWWVIAIAVIVLCLTGCKTQYVPAETVRTEYVKDTQVLRDSIHVMDSIFVREKADTIWITKWRTEYREALRVDTFFVCKTDSVTNVVEVEKPLTSWQKFKLNSAGWILGIFIVCLVIYILYKYIRRRLLII
jgi:hypothetical protein